MKPFLFWVRAARAPFFTGSLAPILVGTGAAYFVTRGAVDWVLAVLALIALTLLHACANLSNDYFDHLSGNDEANTSFATPFTGGSRVIQNGEARPWQVLTAAFICMGLAALIGIYLVYRAGLPILWLGLIGGLTGFFYTAPPLKLAYRGIGEPFIFLDFGLLPVLGAYFLQTGRFDPIAVWAGVPVGLLITAILWINQFQDMEADASVNKRHWVVRFGRHKSAWVHVGLFVLTYVSIVIPVALRLYPPTTLVALLSIPIAGKACQVALASYDDLPHLTPANAATVGAHLITSVLLGLGFLFAGVIPS